MSSMGLLAGLVPAGIGLVLLSLLGFMTGIVLIFAVLSILAGLSDPIWLQELGLAERTVREKLNEILALHTGQPLEKIRHDTDRNYFMSAEEAKNYGLIDKVYEFGRQEKK